VFLNVTQMVVKLQESCDPSNNYRIGTVPIMESFTAGPQATTGLGLTTSQAARHLGVSASTIRRWSDDGYVRCYRTPGGQRRFAVTELEKFMRSLGQRPK
jgi:excisionase family DNA binding protein